MPPVKPSSVNGYPAQRKVSSPTMDLTCLSPGNSGDGPVAAMQHVKIVSAAFLGSTVGNTRRLRPQTSATLNQKANASSQVQKKEVFHNSRSFERKFRGTGLVFSDEESSESESSVGDTINDFSDSSTDEDFQTESEVEVIAEKDKKKENRKGIENEKKEEDEIVHRPGASGDASVRPESVLPRDDAEQKPPPFGDSLKIQEVLKSLQSNLKAVHTSETRPTTPTVCASTYRGRENQESRGSGDTYVENRSYASWAAWSYAKEKQKKEAIRREAEKKKRAEMEERALQEERYRQKRAALLEWMQRKETEREAAEKEKAALLEELRRKEEERVAAAKEASQRALREWRQKKDEQLKERRLQEEKQKAEAQEKEQQRKELAEMRVKEWRRQRAFPSALTASTYINPKPWVNIVELPDSDEEKPPDVAKKPRPRRTRREQDRICARLSRPSLYRATSSNKESETGCKVKLSWVQRVKKDVSKRAGTAPQRCPSASGHRRNRENNLDIILSRSDFKSPASRTSEWIKSVISRRFEEENKSGFYSHGNVNTSDKSRGKSSGKSTKQKSQIVHNSPDAQKDSTPTRPKTRRR